MTKFQVFQVGWEPWIDQATLEFDTDVASGDIDS